MNTFPDQPAAGRRRRRFHSDAFKADAVSACMLPGVSMAAVAMAHGVNANLLRRWVRDAEMKPTGDATSLRPRPAAVAISSSPKPSFVPMQLPAALPADIRIEVRRGAVSIAVTWPSPAAADCAAWLRELLR